jgi:hypothetical protein
MQTDLIAFRPRIAARRSIAALLGTIAAAVIAAGCDATAPKNTTSSPTVAGHELAFSKCVRAHAVPNFPDPGTSATGPENTIGGIAIPSAIDMQSPAFQAALTACRGLLSAGLSPRGQRPITASLRASLIAHAQCMRTHGVPGYQDPTFPASGGIAFTDAGTDPQSPAYIRAAAACGRR